MPRFFVLWNNAQNDDAKRPDLVSKYLRESNETFKVFLLNWSWCIYFTATFLILFSIYYYYYDYKRRSDILRRRQEVHRTNERIPQRRRPGAIYRDHEIIRNVMKTVRQYISPSDSEQKAVKPYVLRRTRSGAIYGRFVEREPINED